MAEYSSVSIRPPKDWQAFERNTRILFANVLRDPLTKTNGSAGQRQNGVDIFGQRDGSGDYVGIQCKGKDANFGKGVSASELRLEVRKALKFEPKLAEFIVVTTAQDDQKIDETARRISAELKRTGLNLRVVVWGWNTLEQHISAYADVFRAFHPDATPISDELLATVRSTKHDTSIIRSLVQPSIENYEDPSRPLPRSAPVVDITKLSDTYSSKLYGRDRHISKLFEAWDGGVRVFVLSAMGGAGKTALARHFVRALENAGWRGAHCCFAWSFTSQGSAEKRQVGSDEFFKEAFRFFSNAPPPRDPRQKGLDLANVIKDKRALLILDGFEPLQYATSNSGDKFGGRRFGAIKDVGLSTLLKLLAENNLGLCLVTTRVRIPELGDNARVKSESLEGIPLLDAIDFLRELGVEPAFGGSALPGRSDFNEAIRDTLPIAYAPPVPMECAPVLPLRIAADLVKVVERARGHALTLSLLGNFLAEFHAGDVRAANELPNLVAVQTSVDYFGVFQAMQAIELALRHEFQSNIDDSREELPPAGHQLALLFFFGLFDRPAPLALIEVVYPPLTGLEGRMPLTGSGVDNNGDPTKNISSARGTVAQDDGIQERDIANRVFAGMKRYSNRIPILRSAIHRLGALGFIADLDKKADWRRIEIDCHPLVREYFGIRLRQLDINAYQGAQRRLYDYFRLRGLPESVRDQASYALLAAGPHIVFVYKARRRSNVSEGRYHALVNSILEGRRTLESSPLLPPTLFSTEAEELVSAVTRVGDDDWKIATEVFHPKIDEEVKPLFNAVFHGCAAGLMTEAFTEVYWPRILKRKRLINRFGLHSEELATLANFFDDPFVRPAAGIPGPICRHLLSISGQRLRAVGRLRDAEDPFRSALRQIENGAEVNRHGLSADIADDLGDLLTTLGRLKGDDGALAVAKVGIAAAAKSADRLRQKRCLSTCAYIAFQMGQFDASEAQFREAIAIDSVDGSDFPEFTSEYRYCELLLARGRAHEAGWRAETASAPNRDRTKTSLKILLEARAMFESILGSREYRYPEHKHYSSGLFTRALECFGRALTELRRTNDIGCIIAGLLPYAEASWICGRYIEAYALVREAQDLAIECHMPLASCDAGLLGARFALGKGDRDAAEELLNLAKADSTKCGYGRRRPDMAVLRSEIFPDKAAVTAAIEAVSCAGSWSLWPRLEAVLSSGAEYDQARNELRSKRIAYLSDVGADPKDLALA